MLTRLADIEGYSINATDKVDLGHIDTCYFDDHNWIIRYLLIGTGTWLPGRTVLGAPQWIDWIDWLNRKVEVEVTAEEIEKSPEYDPEELIDREYEIKLYEHYGREAYRE